MLYQLLNSGTAQCRAERWAIIRILRTCARSEDSLDLAPLRKRHVPSMLMAAFDSVSADAATRGGILDVLQCLASSPTAAVYLVEHAGILSWLRLLLSSGTFWQTSARAQSSADADAGVEHAAADAAGSSARKRVEAGGEAPGGGEAVAHGLGEVEGATRLLLKIASNLPGASTFPSPPRGLARIVFCFFALPSIACAAQGQMRVLCFEFI
jgi:hypothetical protein